jgi:hypothetical protein
MRVKDGMPIEDPVLEGLLSVKEIELGNEVLVLAKGLM